MLDAVIGMLYFVAVNFQSFADHPSKILISNVDKFYMGLSRIMQKNRRVRTLKQNLIYFAIRWDREKHLNTLIKYRRFQKKIFEYILASILLHIINLKTVYSYGIHHYGSCNWSLMSHASTLPIYRKVKPAIQNYKVPIKSVKTLILDSEIDFTVND